MRFLIALVFTLSLNASDYVFNKEFSKELRANILQMSMMINTTSEFSEKDVFAELSKFSEFVESYKGIKYFGGNYQVFPLYAYKGGQKYFTGYKGNLFYDFHSKDNNALEKFLNDLSKIKKSKDTHYNINHIKWITNPNLADEAKDELRDEAIVWSTKYAKELSKKLNKKCTLKEIDFSSIRVVNSSNISMKMSEDAMPNIPNVKQPSYKASITPRITMECK
jgi:ribosomal protein S18